ncbi:MAG: metal-sensing transcriptional repressor [Chloroflexota bacterium]
MQPIAGHASHTGRPGDAPHCHVPASFDPEHREALVSSVKRLVGAAQWLARELAEERGCHAALLQVSVLQADLDAIAGRLVDGHLRYCVREAVAAGAGPDEVAALLTPLQSLLFARGA